MSKTATITFAASVSGDTTVGSVGPISYTVANTSAQHTVTSTVSGNITIVVPQVPAPAQYARIVPPINSALSKWLMATAGDTVGVQISANQEMWLSISPSMTSFIIRSTGVELLEIYFY